MMTNRPLYHLALVELEAVSAHAIRSGRAGLTHDVMLVRDANGLPSLPASSVAGVLRHLAKRELGEEITRSLFGYAEGDHGEPSSIAVSWGLIHDSQNQPVEGLCEHPEQDPLLKHLLAAHPLVRQRVRLNSRGAAADKGKFDATLIPAGARYSLLLRFQCAPEQATQWQQLLALLAHPAFRLGHGTRSGAGQFRIIQLRGRSWDLRNRDELEDFINRPRSRLEARALPQVAFSDNFQPLPTLEMPLVAEQGWRVGGGERSLQRGGESEADLLPQSEPVISWKNGQGELGQRKALLPASAVKGALAHRVAWHYRCLTGHWVDNCEQPEETDACPAVQELFGCASDQGQGRAGVVVIDDVLLDEVQAAGRMHNRIDRYTGGVINGGLFEEELLWKTPFTLRLKIFEHPQNPVSALARQALQRALDDLANGWLPLGAGGGRDLGAMRLAGSVRWNDDGCWLSGNETMEKTA